MPLAKCCPVAHSYLNSKGVHTASKTSTRTCTLQTSGSQLSEEAAVILPSAALGSFHLNTKTQSLQYAVRSLHGNTLAHDISDRPPSVCASKIPMNNSVYI